MDDMDAFDRRLASELDRMAGPGRHVDPMAMVRTLSAPSSERRSQAMSSAVRFVVAGAIVALFGSVLLSGVLLVKPDRERAPAAGASAPAETPGDPSLLAVESASPIPVVPVDWITDEGDPAFRWYGGHGGGDVLLDVALAPSGEAVIVGFDGKRGQGELRDGLIWRSGSGGDWRRSSLDGTVGAQPRRVIPSDDGFVAIGRRKPAGRMNTIWTSSDGIDWLDVTIDGAGFSDLDSVRDTVAILGTFRRAPTVWTSRSGGPWEAATIAEASSGFSPGQLAVSADGVYLVRDGDTGLMYRSEDGLRFTSVDLPDGLEAGDEGRYVSALTRAADGFVLVLGPVEGQREDRSVSAWFSPDGREWRRGDSTPGLTDVQLGTQRPAVRMVDGEGSAPSSRLSFLQEDGTWCAVSPPADPASYYSGTMAWNDKGDVLIAGYQGRYGPPVVWRATGVRCGR